MDKLAILIPFFWNYHHTHGVSETFRESLFQKRNDCQNKIIKPAYRTDGFTAFTVTHCAQMCLNDTNCQTISFSSSQCHTGSFIIDSSCCWTEPNNGGLIYEKKQVTEIVTDSVTESVTTESVTTERVTTESVPTTCYNGGTLLGQTCNCDRCFSGVECERPLVDCSEAEGISNYVGWEGVCTIKPDLSTPFQAYCNFKYGTARTYIQKHFNTGSMFETNWLEYKNGVGDVSTDDFWLGNERLYRMTFSRSYDLVIEMASSGWTEIFPQTYHGFQVSDESSMYTMTYVSTSGTLGDSLFHVNNTKFSTPDNDNDEDGSVNCALTRKCGFWFKGSQCGYGNPNGIIQKANDALTVGIPEEVIWQYDRGNWSPWFVKMWLQRTL